MKHVTCRNGISQLMSVYIIFMIVSEWGDLIIYSSLNIKAWRTRSGCVGGSAEEWNVDYQSVRIQIRSDDDREELTNLSPCINHTVLLSSLNIIGISISNIISATSYYCVACLRLTNTKHEMAVQAQLSMQSLQSSEKIPIILLSYFLMNKK